MAKSMPSDTYWEKRAIARISASEKALDPYAKAIDRIYIQAQQQVTQDINQIYRTYAKGQGIDVEKLLDKLSIEDTYAFWLQMRKDGNLSYIAKNYDQRITRLEQLKGEIYSRVRAIADQEAGVQTKAHAQTINDAYNKNIFDVSQGLNTNIAFGGLNQKTLDSMLNKPWLGANYSNRIWGNTDQLATTVKDMLGASLLTGKSTQSLSGDLAERFGVSRTIAQRLLRTETNYFQNEADALSSAEIGLERYKYLATLDLRTSFVCRAVDNKVFLYKDRTVGVNYPPLHPNCRSTTRAYIGEEYEPATRISRDENGKNVQVQNQSYDQWFKANKVEEWGAKKPPAVEPAKVTPKGEKFDPKKPSFVGAPKGKEMTIEKAVSGANPNYVKGQKDYGWNCQKTVPTYELRRRGYDVEALPYDKNSNAIASNAGTARLWGAKNMDYYSHAKEITRDDGSTYLIRKRTVKSEVVRHLLSYPEGARVQFSYAYTKHRSAHTIMVERVPVSKKYPRGLAFIDPQPMTVSGSFDLVGKTRFSALRLDNREIEAGLVPTIAKKRGKS